MFHNTAATPTAVPVIKVHAHSTLAFSAVLVVELVPPESPDPLPWVIAFEARDADAELALAADLEREAGAAAGPVDIDVIEVVCDCPTVSEESWAVAPLAPAWRGRS